MTRALTIFRRDSREPRACAPGLDTNCATFVASFGTSAAVGFAVLFAAPALSIWPHVAQAQVNRCTTNGGKTVYTDKPCVAVGAFERLPRGQQQIGLTATRHSGCARNLQDLIYEITAAIDNRDINRLGSVYHWVGVSAQSGDRVLGRLQAIVDRPLVDIVAIRSASRPLPPAAAPELPAPTPNEPESFADSSAQSGESVASVAPPAPQRYSPGGPVALRLEQTLRNSATPARTMLGLRRHFDCWWVVLPAQ
jgi:Domain of unknown function (DUF4124)